MKLFWIVIVAFAAACGNNDNNAANSATNTGTAPVSECAEDDDCPGGSTATFADAMNVKCTQSAVRGDYCSECINDRQCAAGFACRDATFCEELPPCNVGSDCADGGSEVHKACIARFCDFCVDDLDCGADEVCYSRLCATRTTVDPTCLDVSCEGPCEIQSNADGVSTGISCVQ